MSWSSVLVDAHVHFHPCFDEPLFFESAEANLSAAARSAGAGADGPWILCFTEQMGHDYHAALSERAGQTVAGWRIESTGERRSLVLRRGENVLVLIAGRQILSAERLELLAIACIERVPDGLPLAEAMRRVRSAGAVPVIPWGFGKWWSDRGRIVAGALQQEPADAVPLLGDNGGRPARAPEPRLFAMARSRGVPVLPGTDPLPFPEQARRVGSYGFVLDAGLDARRPAAALVDRLLELRAQPRTFGRRAGLTAFASAQLRLRFRHRSKHVRSRVPGRGSGDG